MNYVKRIITTFVLLFVAVGVTVQARGTLFDDEYTSCHWSMRLRDTYISDLVLSRDSEDAGTVNVSWEISDPNLWGLGANAWDTSLVVILDDGSKENGETVYRTQSLSLMSDSTSFADVATGVNVEVELAIVVSEPEGDYVISDVLVAGVAQSLLKPSFSAMVKNTEGENVGMFYYIGYNDTFSNFYETNEQSERLTVGVRHGGTINSELKKYMLRILDSDNDNVLSYDASMRTSSGVYLDYLNVGVSGEKYSNVRFIPERGESVEINVPVNANIIGNGSDVLYAWLENDTQLLTSVEGNKVANYSAMRPDYYASFTQDLLEDSERYTLQAWGVNDDGEQLTPIESVEVYPQHTSIMMVDEWFESIKPNSNPEVNGFLASSINVFNYVIKADAGGFNPMWVNSGDSSADPVVEPFCDDGVSGTAGDGIKDSGEILMSAVTGDSVCLDNNNGSIKLTVTEFTVIE